MPNPEAIRDKMNVMTFLKVIARNIKSQNTNDKLGDNICKIHLRKIFLKFREKIAKQT